MTFAKNCYWKREKRIVFKNDNSFKHFVRFCIKNCQLDSNPFRQLVLEALKLWCRAEIGKRFLYYFEIFCTIFAAEKLNPIYICNSYDANQNFSTYSYFKLSFLYSLKFFKNRFCVQNHFDYYSDKWEFIFVSFGSTGCS